MATRIKSRINATIGVTAALTVSLLLFRTGVAADATAGPAASPETASQPLSEIIVTGSRIPQPNFASASPIKVVTSQDILLEGATDVSLVLNTLPQVQSSGRGDFSNTVNPFGFGGVTNADLRGLGPQRTLVLVNGRRLGPGEAGSGGTLGADLDQIPTQLIDSVEVVTGGASAVYGSDAVAGVINFKLKQNFQGVQVDGQYGLDQHDNRNNLMRGLINKAGFAEPPSSRTDGRNKAASVILGANTADGKGNVTGYFTYREADPIIGGNRDFSACQLVAGVDPTNAKLIDKPSCSGSQNSNFFLPFTNFGAYSVVGNQLLHYPQPNSTPPALYNGYAPLTLSRADVRYNGGFSAHYDLNSWAQPYVEFSFMNDRTNQLLGPAAVFIGGNPLDKTGSGGLLVNCDNPLLSAQEVGALCTPASRVINNQVDVLIGRKNVEGPSRDTHLDNTDYRGVFGIKGRIDDAWSYDAFAQYYYTSLFESNTGYLSFSKIQNALLVVTDPTSGQPVCQGGQRGCIPYNIWTQGGVTPAQAQSLAATGTAYGTVTERILNGNVTGELGNYGIRSPLANSGLAVNLGVEHRTDDSNWAADQELLSGDLASFAGSGTNISGSYHVQEEFLELRTPLVQQLPGVYDLTFDGGYRHSKYSTAAGGVNTYKLDLQYSPLKDVRLRGSFERAVRAPDIGELFSPQTVGTTLSAGLSGDPCAGASPTQSLIACEHTGVTAAQYGHIIQCPNGLCGLLFGGNPALGAESANTLSYGVTFAPSYLRGFTGSLDYYKIILKDKISTVPVGTTLNQCLSTGDPTFCNLVVRTSSGQLFGSTIQGGGYISQTYVNIAAAVVSGIDVQLDYSLPLPRFGALSASFSGTYVERFDSQPTPTQVRYNCAGLFGPTCGGVNARWRHNLRVNWQTPIKLTLSAQWRFISAVKLDSNTGNPALQNNSPPYGTGVFDSFDARLPNMSYLDLSANWQITHVFSLRAGVNNVMDKDPPLVSQALVGLGAPNTYPIYDLLGRQIFAGFTAKF
jgi:iron complex outermembrane recepter protein